MYECKIVADSVGPNGIRLTSLVVTLPRIVLAELNTHRMFSRNSASSRAIPFKRQIERLEADPFIPEEWGSNQRGMQAGEALDGWRADEAGNGWRRAMVNAIGSAKLLTEIGVHKQLANRLLEPFLPHTVLITATEWANFYALRCHPDAQPQIRRAAESMRAAMGASRPREIEGGAWHLPFVDDDELDAFDLATAIAVSAGRSARLSYLTHEGERDPGKDVALAERLLRSGHMSPFEHVAQAIGPKTWKGVMRVANEADRLLRDSNVPGIGLAETDALLYSGNLRGWRQLRKCLLGEAVYTDRYRGQGLVEAISWLLQWGLPID